MNKTKEQMNKTAKELFELYSINETAKAIIDPAIERYISIWGNDDLLQACILKYRERLDMRAISERLQYHPRTIYKLLDKFFELFTPLVFQKKYILAILLEIIEPRELLEVICPAEDCNPPCGMPVPDEE